MLKPNLFLRRTAEQSPQTHEAPASRADKSTPSDQFETKGHRRASDARDAAPGETAKSPGVWGAMMGGLGRMKKAAAGAVLGAMAFGVLGTGGAMAAEPVNVADATPAAVVQTVDVKSHVVVPNDTMWGISQRHGVSLNTLVELNPHIADPAKIKPGDRIRLSTSAPPVVEADPTTVEVLDGDSMWKIAGRVGVNPSALVAANPQYANPSLIQPGDVLNLPVRGAGAADAAVKAPAPVEPPPPPAVDADDDPPAAPAGQGVEAPKAEAADKPGPLDKLWREVRKLTFDLLVDQDLDQSKEIPLGEHFTAGLGLEAMFLDSAAGKWTRMAFQRGLEDGQKALWVKAKGNGFLSGKHDGEVLDVDGKVSFDYSMVRPHVYDKDAPDPVAAAKDLVTNVYRLPFGHEAARRLSQGSTFTFEADATLDAEGKLSFGTVSADASADYALEVERRDAAEVQVTYRRGANLDAALAADDLRDGTLDVGLNFELGRGLEHTYRIDLSRPDGKRAYDALLSFRGGRVGALAEIEGNGVRLVSEDDTSARGLSGRVRHQGEDGLDVTVTGGVQRDRDGDEVTTRYNGGVDAKIDPEDSDTSARLVLTGRRVVEEDERRTDLTGALTVDHEVSEDTDLKLETRVERGHEVDEQWETETRSGRLAHGGVLTTKLARSDGEPLELGFSANTDVRFELETPIGEDGLVPLTGDQMRRSKEGTRLTLRGEGKLGFDAEQGFEDLDLTFATTGTGRLEVVAQRLAGDEVRVHVDLEREVDMEAGLRYSLAQDDGGRYTAKFSHEVDRDAEKSASFTLSLDKASHREAYKALLKGNLGPATRLLDTEAPSWVKSRSNVQTIELEAGPVEWFDAGIELVRRDLDPSDSRIRWDSQRRAFTEAATEAGKDVRWIEAQGALAPKLSYRGSAPVGGPIAWRHGFSAGKTLRYRAFAPSVDGASPTLSPAFSAADALALPRGAEFELMGRGTLSGFSGAGFGTEWGASSFVVSATASADTKHEYARTWEVEVQRLGDSKVEVSLERGSDRENAFEIAARAGVEVDSEQLLGLESAVEQLALLGKATDALDEALEKRLMVELEASWSKKKADSTRLTFELDLAKPAARAAYEGLVKLEADAAMQAVDREASGVRITRGTDRKSVETREHAHFDVFGERLYLRDALRRDETTIERWDGGQRQTDRSSYREERENLIGRERDVHWEAVRVRTGDDPVGKGYYRLRYHDDDPMTSKDEVRSLLSLGQDLSAEPVRAPRVQKGARGLKKLFGSWARHGSTKLDMDIFFTGAGIDGIRGFTEAQALQRYGEVAARREGRGAFGWADPAKAERAVALMEEYFELKDSPFHDDREAQDEERSIEVAYWRLTRNEMWEDREAYESARAFAKMVGRMNQSEDPAAWNRAFADMGEALGFDFYDAVATMQSMAGKDELLVHQMRMKGKAVDIEMKDEGLLRVP